MEPLEQRVGVTDPAGPDVDPRAVGQQLASNRAAEFARPVLGGGEVEQRGLEVHTHVTRIPRDRTYVRDRAAERRSLLPITCTPCAAASPPGAKTEARTLMAEHPSLDEATRPRAPRHPNAERTASGAASAEMLVSVHANLRAELEQIRDVIAEVAAGRIAADTARSLINDMSMRQNYWSLGAFCATFCRVVTVHHTIEDVSVFPSLKMRDPELGPVIDRLVEEHEVVAAISPASISHSWQWWPTPKASRWSKRRSTASPTCCCHTSPMKRKN